MSTPETTSDGVFVAVAKVFAVWLAYLTGLSLGQWFQLAGLVFTLLQIYVLVRDKLWRNGKT